MNNYTLSFTAGGEHLVHPLYMYIHMDSLSKVATERMEHVSKHYRTVESDVEINKDEQLLEAALLLIYSVSDDYAFSIASIFKEPPIGWSKEIWNKILNKSHKERLIVAASFLMAEYDRLNQQEENE